MKIMIVDDIGYSLRSLQMVLVRADHKVIEAKSGQAALDALKNDHAIEAVITDLLMPDMDGVDLFIKAKRLERFNDQGQLELPEFILLTSAQAGRPGTNRETGIRLRLAKEIGFMKVMFKPLDQKKLLQTLEKIEANRTGRTVDVLRSIGQIKHITNSVIETTDREAVVGLLECLEEQGRMLREFVANAGDDS